MWRINAYRDRIFLIVSLVGTGASVAGLAIPFFIANLEGPKWVLVLFIVMLALMGFLVFVALRSDTRTKVYKISDRLGIRDYMYRWIRNGQRVAIWTRDMSWVSDDEMKGMLREKARSSDLIVCVPEETDTLEYLKDEGAEIVVYHALSIPALTFTIVNFGHAGSRVAVGMRRGDNHVIQEFSASDEHPAFHMAQDLVRLVRELNSAVQS